MKRKPSHRELACEWFQWYSVVGTCDLDYDVVDEGACSDEHDQN